MAKAKIETFIDESPAEDKSRRAGGTSATEHGTLAGDLATEVTNAILDDFSKNQVFEVIKKKIDDPDIIIKGKIRRFYGKAGPNALFWFTIPVDILWLLGLPVMSDEGEVDLEISVYRPDGFLLGTYSGKSEFSGIYTMYTNVTFGIGTRLNKAFDEVLRKIREKILTDESKFTTQTSQKMGQ